MKDVAANRVSQPLLNDVHWWFYRQVQRTQNRVIERYSLEDIARETGHGVSAVSRAIKDLVQAGVIKIEKNHNGMYPRRYVYTGPVQFNEEAQRRYIEQLERRNDELRRRVRELEQYIEYLESQVKAKKATA